MTRTTTAMMALAGAAVLLASVLATPATAATVMLSAPLMTSPAARYVRVTILNGGPAVTLSNGNFYATPASSSMTPIPKSFDNCTVGPTLATGYICSLTITLPSPTTTVWFSITATASANLRGALQILDINNNTLAVSDLK